MLVLPLRRAFADSFVSDPDWVEKTSLSVLMLEVYDDSSNLIATASGVVLFDNRTLVTNYHVIEEAASIIAYNDNNDRYLLLDVLIADKNKDLAILYFWSPTDMQPLPLNADGALKRIEPVVAIGSPLGQRNTTSIGNISAVYAEDGVQYVQFTAPISRGSSGGALLDDAGCVIGITSASYINGQNMNLAVHASEIVRLYQRWDGKTIISLKGFASHETPTPTPKPTATPKPTVKRTATPNPTATPDQVFEITSMTVSNGKVKVSWKDSGNNTPYTVKYVLHSSGNFDKDLTAQGFYWTKSKLYLKYATIDYMVPGKTYWVVVENKAGNTTERKTVKLPYHVFTDFKNKPYIDDFSLKKRVGGRTSTVTKLNAADIRFATALTKYGCYFEYHYPQLKNERSYHLQVVAVSPDGWRHVVYAGNDDLPQGDYYGYFSFLSLEYFFDNLKKARDGFVPTGQYRLEMYWDGKYVDQVMFRVY